jgi:hypothetical protein
MGAHLLTDGQRIGLIILPEICANLCFVGRSETVCSWRAANPCTRCMWRRRERTSPERVHVNRSTLAPDSPNVSVNPLGLAWTRLTLRSG